MFVWYVPVNLRPLFTQYADVCEDVGEQPAICPTLMFNMVNIEMVNEMTMFFIVQGGWSSGSVGGRWMIRLSIFVSHISDVGAVLQQVGKHTPPLLAPALKRWTVVISGSARR